MIYFNNIIAEYLNDLEHPVSISKEDIFQVLARFDLEKYKLLKKFALKFDGFLYSFYDRFEIELKLIKCWGYPPNVSLAYIDFEIFEGVRHFLLTYDDYPVQISIDENLKYYEDFSLKAESFEDKLFDLSLFHFCKKKCVKMNTVIKENVDLQVGVEISASFGNHVKWFQQKLCLIREDEYFYSIFEFSDVQDFSPALHSPTDSPSI